MPNADYWWGVATPFIVIIGCLLVWAVWEGCCAFVDWALPKAHRRLLKEIPLRRDLPPEEVERRSRAFAETMVRAGGFRLIPLFGWHLVILHDFKDDKETKKETRND